MAVVAALESQTSSMSYGFTASLDLDMDMETSPLIFVSGSHFVIPVSWCFEMFCTYYMNGRLQFCVSKRLSRWKQAIFYDQKITDHSIKRKHSKIHSVKKSV